MRSKRVYAFSKQLATNFTNTAVKHFHPDDHPILQLILNISDRSCLTPINRNSDINDSEIVEEVLKYIGKAGSCKIADILLFILPDLINRHVLNSDDPVINLRISGNSRNVGRKVKHV